MPTNQPLADTQRSQAERAKSLIARSPLVWFFVLAFAFSWVVTVPMVFLQGPPQWTVLATSAPTLAALVVSRITTGRFRFWSSAVDWTRLVCGSAAGAALVVTAYIVLPGIFTADPRKLNWSILASLHVFNYSTLLGGPIGEEVGWTGYAMARLEERFGAVPGVLLLGLLWSSWHLPLFLRPGFYSAPFWIYTLILVGLRLIIGACVNWSRFSIAVAIVMHASFNTVSRWLGGLFRDVQPRSSLPFELVLAFGGLSVAAILVLGTRGRLGFSPEVGISQAIPPDSFRSTA